MWNKACDILLTFLNCNRWFIVWVYQIQLHVLSLLESDVLPWQHSVSRTWQLATQRDSTLNISPFRVERRVFVILWWKQDRKNTICPLAKLEDDKKFSPWYSKELFEEVLPHCFVKGLYSLFPTEETDGSFWFRVFLRVQTTWKTGYKQQFSSLSLEICKGVQSWPDNLVSFNWDTGKVVSDSS